MELYVKRFSELTVDELYDIARLRANVFILEQEVGVEDLDGRDRTALHVFLKDAEGIEAYLRITDRDSDHPDIMIGRVVAAKRRRGLGTEIVKAGIKAAREIFGAEKIVAEAQTYAKGLYEKCGFTQTSDVFYEEGIPHIPHVRMEL